MIKKAVRANIHTMVSNWISKNLCPKQKRRGRSIYLLFVYVMERKENPIPTKIVCVRSKANRKDLFAFICTNTTLSGKAIIHIYRKRWKIEIFFKTCKPMPEPKLENLQLILWHTDSPCSHCVYLIYVALNEAKLKWKSENTWWTVLLSCRWNGRYYFQQITWQSDGCLNGNPSGNLKTQWQAIDWFWG